MIVYFRIGDRYRIELHDDPKARPVDHREMTVAEMLSYSDESVETLSAPRVDLAFAARAGLFDEDLVLSVVNESRPIVIVP